MTSTLRGLGLICVCSIALGGLSGCGDDSGTTADSGRVRPDAGPGRDTGPGGCGEVGAFCCSSEPRCDTGARCDRDGTCCSGSGASCADPEDCCEGSDCVGGSCCNPGGTSCRAPSDCCLGFLCMGGMCTMASEDCGIKGAPCCAPDDACEAGTICAGGTCEPCGSEGDICCKPPEECETGLVCSEGRCAMPTGECGADGQPCCDGVSCTTGLRCSGGTCSAPTSACDYAGCDDCVTHAPCGWCGDTGRCQPGTDAAPDEGTCADWAWVPRECSTPTDCDGAASCDDCTARAGCGWCDGGGCQPGTASGPTGGSCTSWNWLRADCAAPEPSRCSETDCGSCTAVYPCGWCGDTNTCLEGTSSGPSTGSCGAWSWTTTDCRMADACTVGASNCGDCTAMGACGWCASTGTCLTGGSTGPDVGSCSDWDYISSDCTCGAPMTSCSVDADCCTDLSCRRGVTFDVQCCQEATSTCTTGADCCGFMDCVTGRCACRAVGRACLDNRDCCSNSCVTGTCR